MKAIRKALAEFMTVLMLFSALSAGFMFGVSATFCNHNIGVEDTTLVQYSKVEPTCNSKGKVSYQCTNCNYTVTEDIAIDPDNHTFGWWSTVEGEEPTCAEEGVKIRYCQNCGYSETGVANPTGKHVYADASVLDFWWTMSDKKVGAVYEGWTIVSLPTCVEEGIAKTACTVCSGAEITHELDIHSANYKIHTKKDPSCVTKGSCTVYCEVCNANYTLVVPIDEDNHAWLYEVTTEPTCTEKGVETAYCNFHPELTDTPTREIPATGHSFTQYKYNKDANCNKDGTKTAKCDNCDATDTVTAEGTKTACVTKWVFVDGNCAAGGAAKLDCIYADCKVEYNETKVFAPYAHPNRTTVTTAATCTASGLKQVICPECGVLSTEVIDKTGHSIQVVNKKSASCISKQDRIDLEICSVCGHTEEIITPYEHNYITVAVAVEPGCVKAGSTAHLRCLDCGYEEKAKSIPALGHNDKDNDGCCNVCYVYFVENSAGEVVDCKCLCHNPDGIANLFFKIYNFFCKLFGMNQTCECGKLHYETAGIN